MKQLIPTVPQIVKGFVITIVSLFLIKFLPANIKSQIMG